jgi:cullin 3
MVLHKFGDKLYKGVSEALCEHLELIAARIEEAQGLPFLKELKACWDAHNKSTQMIRDILMVSRRSGCSADASVLRVLLCVLERWLG